MGILSVLPSWGERNLSTALCQDLPELKVVKLPLLASVRSIGNASDRVLSKPQLQNPASHKVRGFAAIP